MKNKAIQLTMSSPNLTKNKSLYMNDNILNTNNINNIKCNIYVKICKYPTSNILLFEQYFTNVNEIYNYNVRMNEKVYIPSAHANKRLLTLKYAGPRT